MMKTAIEFLPSIDIQLFFGFLMNLTELDDIAKIENKPEIISNEIDCEFYKQYKKGMDTETEKKGKYVHAFKLFWRRPLRSVNGKIYTQIIPAAAVAPIEIIDYWARKILKVSSTLRAKIQALKALPMAAPRQVQGSLESHFRVWVKPVYVHLYFIYASFIYYLYMIYILFIYHLLC